MGSPKGDDDFRTGMVLFGFVTSLPILTVGGALLGKHLDQKAGTAPWMMLGGFLLGTVACAIEAWVVWRSWRKRPR